MPYPLRGLVTGGVASESVLLLVKRVACKLIVKKSETISYLT